MTRLQCGPREGDNSTSVLGMRQYPKRRFRTVDVHQSPLERRAISSRFPEGLGNWRHWHATNFLSDPRPKRGIKMIRTSLRQPTSASSQPSRPSPCRRGTLSQLLPTSAIVASKSYNFTPETDFNSRPLSSNSSFCRKRETV